MENKKGRTLKVTIEENETVIYDIEKREQQTLLEEIESSDEENVKQCGCSVKKFYSLFADDLVGLYRESGDETTLSDHNVLKRNVVVTGESAKITLAQTTVQSKTDERVIIVTDEKDELTDEYFDTKPFGEIVSKLEEIETNNDVKNILRKIVDRIESESTRKERNIDDVKSIMQDLLRAVTSDPEVDNLDLESRESIQVQIDDLDGGCLNFPSASSSSKSIEIQVTDLSNSSCGSVFFLDDRLADIMNTEDCYCTDLHVYKSPVSFSSRSIGITDEEEQEEEKTPTDAEIKGEYEENSYFPYEKKYDSKAEQYVEEHKIKDVFDYLCSKLLAHTPSNPIEFLINLLDQCLIYRETRLTPPLLFNVKHIESLFKSMDPMGLDVITTDQYKTAMFTLGLTDYSRYPMKSNQTYVSKEFFLREATRVMINNLDDIIQDHDIYKGSSRSWSSCSGSRNGSTIRPNTRI